MRSSSRCSTASSTSRRSARGSARAHTVVVAGSIGRVEALSPTPGVVVQRSPGDALVTVASRELSGGALDAALEPLRVPGIEVVVDGGEPAVLWEKAARLAVLAAATVSSGLAVGQLRADATWCSRLREALTEACAVAIVDGVDARLRRAMGDHRGHAGRSHDLGGARRRRGRPTELDAITGSVVRAGARLGVPTPALARLLEEASCRAP